MWWLLCFLPLIEAPIEAYYELAKKISVNHFWTAVARGVLMVLIGVLLSYKGVTLYWWQGFVLSFGIFVALFNYLYNLMTHRPIMYLRAHGIDSILAHAPPWGRWIFEIIILGAAIQIYVRPQILF